MIPMHYTRPAVDFCRMTSYIDEKYNINHRDMAGRYSPEGHAEFEAAKSKWLTENGFEDTKYVLDKPEGSNEDWPKDSDEMKLRIKINKMMGDLDKFRRPYLDVWHYLLDNDFVEVSNGSYQYLELNKDRLCDPDEPEFVRTWLTIVYGEVQDCEAYDGEFLYCYVWW